MKKYTNSFIGIPLPDQFAQEFIEISQKVKDIEPGIITVYPHTPHITIFYLATQTDQSLQHIAEKIKPHLDLLHDTTLTVSGLGYFTQEQPRVLFANIEYPENFVHYHTLLQEELTDVKTDSRANRFHPHLTVGRMKTEEVQSKFLAKKGQFEILFHQLNWQFAISEIVLYGVDLNQPNPHQEKVITLKVN